MGLSNKLSCEAGSFSRHLNPHRCYQSEVLRLYFPCTRTLSCVVCLTPQLFLPVYPHVNVGTPGPPAATSIPTGVFNQWFEALFPQAGALGCEVCFPPQLFLPIYLHENVGPPAPPATLPRVLSAQLPVSTPPTGLGECFFFISLVARFPYSSIFCQFWLFFCF